MAVCQKMQSLAHQYAILHCLRTTGLVVCFKLFILKPTKFFMILFSLYNKQTKTNKKNL